VLREIVRDQAALGENWISMSKLLGRLGLGPPLDEILGIVLAAKQALAEGETCGATASLDLIEFRLRRLTVE
jgi:hypothetical protein